MTAFLRGARWYWKFYFRGARYGPKGGYSTKRKALNAEADRRREIGALARQQGDPGISVQGAIGRYIAERLPTVPTAIRARHTMRRFQEWMAADPPLASVTAADIEAYRTWRRGHSFRLGRTGLDGSRPVLQAGVKGTTLNRDLADLSAFFAWALRQAPPLYRGPNPCLAAHVHRDPDTWAGWIVPTPAQQMALWKALPARQRVKALLLKHLGVRRGVVLGLRWEQVDLANALVTYRSKGKTRTIPLNETALGLLHSLKPQTSGPVFQEKSITSFRRAWDKARKAIGLPGLRPHDLRVTFSRELASTAGVDLATIQDLLGHSTITMARRYVPESLRAMRRAVRSLDRPEGLRGLVGGPRRRT